MDERVWRELQSRWRSTDASLEVQGRWRRKRHRQRWEAWGEGAAVLWGAGVVAWALSRDPPVTAVVGLVFALVFLVVSVAFRSWTRRRQVRALPSSTAEYVEALETDAAIEARLHRASRLGVALVAAFCLAFVPWKIFVDQGELAEAPIASATGLVGLVVLLLVAYVFTRRRTKGLADEAERLRRLRASLSELDRSADGA